MVLSANHRNRGNQMVCTIPQERADYHMANRRNAQTRSKKGVPSQGAGSDFHYRGQFDWLWMSELALDIYRNNMIVGSMTDRAIENQLQGGFTYDPDTGDKNIDADLKSWWNEVSQDPRQCDPDAELTFAEQEEMVLRAIIVQGDVLGLPQGDENGTVDIIEGHRLRSPSRKVKERIVHGIEFVPDSAARRRVAYWILKDQVDPNKRGGIRKQDLQPYLAWDDDGERNVFHAHFAKRAKQTRGVTAYAPLFDVAGYHDDCQFLKMVQQRAASLFVFVRKRSSSFDPAYLAAEQNLGVDVTQDKARDYELNERQYREVGAGSTLNSLPGEDIDPWSSNIPNAEFFQHAKMLLTFMGVNLGMPLVMALMDASETNFSGYRGAVDQARMGFRANQRRLKRRWHVPYMRFKLFKRAEQDSIFNRHLERSLNPRSKINVFRHTWNSPSWPYIDPFKDMAADLGRLANGMASPTQVCDERGENWDTKSLKTCRDWAQHLRNGIVEAQALKKEFGEDLDDVDTFALAQLFAKMPMAERTQLSFVGEFASDESKNNGVTGA